MKATCESTGIIVEIEVEDLKIPARVWIGKTESGVEFQMLVTRVAVGRPKDQTQFEKDLRSAHAPTPVPCAFPLRMVL